MTVRLSLWLFILALISGAANLWAGDTATFVDLGFSPDGKTYAFAQYGVQSGTLKPWAELFVVDVGKNNFVNGGRVSYIHDSPVTSGQDGSGALYRIIARNNALIDRYRINYLNQGFPLFVSMDESASSPKQFIEFRDFVSGTSYNASLISRVDGLGNALASSFFINIEKTIRNGMKKTYTIGTPALRRSQIVSYRISRVIVAPNDSAMIFVIEMKKRNNADFDYRYMVEALRP